MPAVPSNTSPRPLAQRLAAYGCTSDVIIRLDEKLSAPDQLDYLDLLPKQSNHTPVLTAVAEHQGTALLYLVDASGDVRSDAESLAAVRRQLANRSDPAWLGVVRPGTLEIFPIGFHEAADATPVRTIEEHSPTAPMFFQSLVHGTFEENHRLRGTDYVFHKIFDLLTRTTNEFVPKDGKGQLDALEVLSMAGVGGSQEHGGALSAVMSYINSPQVGGISGLQQMFHDKGLGGIAASWIGTGQNLPISADQLQSVLHSGALQSVAQKAGIDPSQLTGMMAQLLPHVVDKLTPNGQVPDASSLAQMMKGLAAGQS